MASNRSNSSGNLQRREFIFPGSSENVEILTYKNLDGSFKNAECVLPLVRKTIDKINEHLLLGVTTTESARYNLRMISKFDVKIMKVEKVGETWDFDSSVAVKTLDAEQLSEFKNLVVTGVSNLMALFTTYYTQKDQSTTLSETNGGNQELATLLRFASGAKGQTYFDVIGHIVLTQAYTLSSLFSTTGLYYLAYKKLRGNAMLKHAQRKVISSTVTRVYKGEIHLGDGLIIFHEQQFKLFGPRRQRTTTDESTFERITYEELTDGTLNELHLTEGEASNVDMSLEERYALTQSSRVLTFGGSAAVQQLLPKIAEALEPYMHDITSIDCEKPTALLDLFKILQRQKVRSIINEISEYVCNDRKDEVFHALKNIDGYESREASLLLSSMAMNFLALCDFDTNHPDETILNRLIRAEDTVDVVKELLVNFIQCM